MPLAGLSAGFQSLPQLPTSKLSPSGADSQKGGFLYILGPCGSLQWTLLWGWEFLLLLQPHRFLQSEVLRLYFPMLELCVVGSILLPICSSWCIHTQMWDFSVLQLLPCWESSPPGLPISAPPTSLGECFFFNSLVVGYPYSSIYWQFWVFFALNLLLFFCWLWGDKVYLPMPPSWPEVTFAAIFLSSPFFFTLPFQHFSWNLQTSNKIIWSSAYL